MNGSEKPPLSRGGKRARELGAAAEAERRKLEAEILNQVGGEPSTLHKIAAEALSSALINARRKRASGRYDSAELKLVAQLLRATGLKPPPMQAPAPPSLEATLAAIVADEEADLDEVDE